MISRRAAPSELLVGGGERAEPASSRVGNRQRWAHPLSESNRDFLKQVAEASHKDVQDEAALDRFNC